MRKGILSRHLSFWLPKEHIVGNCGFSSLASVNTFRLWTKWNRHHWASIFSERALSVQVLHGVSFQSFLEHSISWDISDWGRSDIRMTVNWVNICHVNQWVCSCLLGWVLATPLWLRSLQCVHGSVVYCLAVGFVRFVQ